MTTIDETAKALWDLASVYLALRDCSSAYRTRKVWREGLEVAMKIKGSQGQRRVVWVKTEHPFTAIRDVPLNKVPGVLIAVGCIRAAMHR